MRRSLLLIALSTMSAAAGGDSAAAAPSGTVSHAIAAKPSAAPKATRLLRFPDMLCGTLETVTPCLDDPFLCPHQKLGAAKGAVSVAADAKVRLNLSYEAADMNCLKNLKAGDLFTLAANGLPTSNDDLKNLCHLKQLKALRLSELDITDQGMEALTALPELVSLNISRNQISNAAMIHIAKIKSLHNLALKGSNLSDEGLLALAPLHDLRTLDVERGKMTNKGLSVLKNFPKLENLVLQHCNYLTDYGIKSLKPIARTLRMLNLSGTSISDASVDDLKAFTKLSLLRVTDTRLTAAGVKQLQTALPHCQIITVDPKKSLPI